MFNSVLSHFLLMNEMYFLKISIVKSGYGKSFLAEVISFNNDNTLQVLSVCVLAFHFWSGVDYKITVSWFSRNILFILSWKPGLRKYTWFNKFLVLNCDDYFCCCHISYTRYCVCFPGLLFWSMFMYGSLVVSFGIFQRLDTLL